MDGWHGQHTAATDRAAGFTLVELVVCVGVLAVMAGWGLPAFGELTRDTARTREVNRFVQAIHLARSEAIKIAKITVMITPAEMIAIRLGTLWAG